MPRREWLRALPIVAALVAVLVLAGALVNDRLKLHARRNMLSGLCVTCKLYARDHDGKHPPNLPAIFPKYVNSRAYLDYATEAVEYFPGSTEQTDPTGLLMRERRPDARGRRWIGHIDCSVELERMQP